MQRNQSNHHAYTLQELMQYSDVMLHLFSFLSTKEIAPVSSVCKKFNFFASNHNLWQNFSKRDYGLDVPKNLSDTAKEYYRTIVKLAKILTKEKEVAIAYYVYSALLVLDPILDKARYTQKYTSEPLYNVLIELMNNPKLSLFTYDDVMFLMGKQTFAELFKLEFDHENPHIVVKARPQEFVLKVKAVTDKLYGPAIDLLRIVADSYIDAICKNEPLPANSASLPILDMDNVTAICLFHHPELAEPLNHSPSL